MSELKVNKVSPVTGTELTLGDSGDTIDLSATTVTLPANSVNSDQYVDGSIDTAHVGNDQIDSQHYIAGSIDNEHLADDAVGLAELSATGTPSASNFLRGDNSWQEAGGGAWTFIATAVADDDASITLTGISATYETYKLIGTGLHPATNGVYGRIRLGDSSGIDSGGDNYDWVVQRGMGSYIHPHTNQPAPTIDGTAYQGSGATATDTHRNEINVSNSTPIYGSDTGEGGGFDITLSNPRSSTVYPLVSGTAYAIGHEPHSVINSFCGYRKAYITTDRIQFYFNSGNITTGRITLYGIKHS